MNRGRQSGKETASLPPVKHGGRLWVVQEFDRQVVVGAIPEWSDWPMCRLQQWIFEMSGVLKAFVNLEVFCGMDAVMAFTEKSRDALEAFDFSIGKLAINLQPLQKREVILPSWVTRVAHLHRYEQFL